MDFVRGEQYKEKGSRFLGFSCAVESADRFKEFMALVKKEHKNAKHFCYAYIINERAEGEQAADSGNIIRKEKSSNDREPGGCGIAILETLKRTASENRAVIVVRYFGGVLLGAGPLMRAYATAARSCLIK